MDIIWRTIIWQQYGAAIDMLENAIRHCPAELWGDRKQQPEFWYVAYHTIFFLDYMLCDSPADYQPPAPFTLSELDPTGVMPERVYTQDELLNFLEHGRQRCQQRIATMTPEQAQQRCGVKWLEMSEQELLIHSTRHVQHHTAQLYLILRQQIDSAPKWVFKAKQPLR